MRKLLTLCALVALCGSFNAQANAVVLGPIKWDVNGHYYEVVGTQMTWEEARLAAEASVFMGVHGYLATVTSAEENLFITNNLPVYNNEWLGGFQPAGSSEPAGGWSWVTGEAWEFTNWNSGEPNNAGGYENFLHYTSVINSNGRTWNDVYPTNIGYVVEYAPVPEPSSLILGLMGISGALGFKKRKNSK